jgi:thiamine pyridinylase
MKKIHLALIIILCGIVLFAGIVLIQNPGAEKKNATADRPVLKVALYPYLEDVSGDDHAATIRLLKERYHQLYPDDDLEIYISDEYSTYFSDSRNFSPVFGPGGPDIVEVEQTGLDNLREDGYIRPFAPVSRDAARMLNQTREDVVSPYKDLGTVDGSVYFVPTWLCAHYTFTRNPPGTAPESGDFSGNGTLPDLYLSAYASTYGADPALLDGAVRDAVNGSPDPEVTDVLASSLSACTGTDGRNRCLDGDYAAKDGGLSEFVSGKTDRYVGFSEMLYGILKESPGDYDTNLTISGTVYGKGTYPSLAWADGFVMNNNTGTEKTDEAIRFIEFYNSPETKEIIALSLDTGNDTVRVPRYLLPASEGFYSLPNVSSDRYYRQFSPVIHTMVPFPTGGLRGNMDAIYCSVTAALQEKGMDVNYPARCTLSSKTAVPA